MSYLDRSPPFTTVPSEDAVIEVWRGIAATLVMLTHLTHWLMSEPGIWGFGSTGVDLFFVLSGYVFAPHLMAGALRLGPHLLRRFFRLYPLYFCALLLYVGLHQPLSAAWDHWGVHLLMAHTLQSLAIAGFYNPAFWSLPPEVEFYVALPLLCALAVRWRLRVLVGAALGLHLLLVALAPLDTQTVSARAIATVHLPGLLIEFLIGTVAWSWARAPGAARSKPWRLGFGVVVLFGMMLLYHRYVATTDSGATPLWIAGNMGLGAACGYGLVVSALALKPWRWLVGLGHISYGVYLFHNAASQLVARFVPAVSGWAGLVLSVLATLLLAWLGHRFIENPLRQFGRHLSQRWPSPRTPALG